MDARTSSNSIGISAIDPYRIERLAKLNVPRRLGYGSLHKHARIPHQEIFEGIGANNCNVVI